jgi:hypothetical protein
MLETFFFATLASDVDPVATLSILGQPSFLLAVLPTIF